MIVLTYHKIVSSSAFEKQVQYLNNKDYFGSRNKKRLLITADDGDPSFYHNAFPVLKKYDLPAILFVVTDLINSQKPFWWDEIAYYLEAETANKKIWEVKSWPNKKR